MVAFASDDAPDQLAVVSGVTSRVIAGGAVCSPAWSCGSGDRGGVQVVKLVECVAVNLRGACWWLAVGVAK